MTTDNHPIRRRGWALLGAAGTAAVLALGAGAPTLTAAAASTHAKPTKAPKALHHAALSETDNGTTITVHRGATIKLTLHSTYWTVAGSSKPAVVAERGTPTVNAHPPQAAHCVPGGGCGTVTASFAAVAQGTADITASRTTCGEAMMCSPDMSSYTVHVVVVR